MKLKEHQGWILQTKQKKTVWDAFILSDAIISFSAI